jgi:hypothetical protein
MGRRVQIQPVAYMATMYLSPYPAVVNMFTSCHCSLFFSPVRLNPRSGRIPPLALVLSRLRRCVTSIAFLGPLSFSVLFEPTSHHWMPACDFESRGFVVRSRREVAYYPRRSRLPDTKARSSLSAIYASRVELSNRQPSTLGCLGV